MIKKLKSGRIQVNGNLPGFSSRDFYTFKSSQRFRRAFSIVYFISKEKKAYSCMLSLLSSILVLIYSWVKIF